MSIVIETLVYCDGDDCPLEGAALHNSDLREQTATQQLRNSGWATRWRKHFCPDCRKIRKVSTLKGGSGDG